MSRKFLKWIPNALTSLNLVCGFAAILVLYKLNHFLAVPVAAGLTVVSVIADFFDGFAARKFKVESRIGEFLDSFADIVSFGVAPAFLINCMSINTEIWAVLLIGAVTTIYVVCGAYRLARYGISHSSDHFEGLPITAAGFITSSYCLVWYLCLNGKTAGIAFIAASVPLCIILALAMISRIKVMRLAKPKRISEDKKDTH